ncbi:beta-lactamase family protein [Balneolaceae bacterium YR4-1]|uniref:Beta-lactamase family protein n=1 Tax=Halalkalibaculum roseum TaxID=2709311 RepID=A0A6M1SQB5_9BACT|nr:serine hydrolase domain-containing protein [Halalkalibaculum roseum]NGP77551.1 beta-lactamase family protein [Halalkalibaculum roseum]
MRYLFIDLLFLLLFLPSLSFSQSSNDDPISEFQIEAFSADLDSLRKANHIPGLAAAIVKDREIAWSNGFGSSHFDTGDGEVFKAVTPDTPFWIASVTKTFLGLLFLQLEEQGEIDLNDRINEMPGWDNFCSWLAGSEIVFGRNLHCDASITIRNVLNHTVNGKPGTGFMYNPLMYSRLSRYIEYVYGNPISAAEGRHNTMAQLVQEHILGPAGMNRTMSSMWQRDKALVYFDMSQGFEYNDGEYVRQRHIERHLAGGAGIVSTVADLAKYDIALDSGILASDLVMEKLFTPAVAPVGTTLPYAFGWYVQEYRGEKFIWHAGWDEKAGFSALFLKVPERNLTLILLANSEGIWWGNPLDGAAVEKSEFARLFMDRFVYGEER